MLTSLEIIHRVGTRKGDSDRPVIKFLFDFNERTELFKYAFKPKNTGLSLSDDYSRDVRIKRNHLWENAKAKNDEGERSVKLSHDKMFTNGKLYTWDPERQEVAQVKPP